jgi:hypothetical protein
MKNQLTRAYFLAEPSRSLLAVDNSGATKIVRLGSTKAASPVTVVVAEYAGALKVIPPSVQAEASGAIVLDAKDATKEFNYNNRGYYEGPTVYKLRWDFTPKRAGKYHVAVIYRKNESEGPLEIAVGAQRLPITLKHEKEDEKEDEPAVFTGGSVTLGAAESFRLSLTPKHPFRKGQKLGVVIDKLVLTPAE